MSDGKENRALPAVYCENLVEQGRVKSTKSALAGADALGMNFDGMKEVIKNLEVGDLHKA